MKKEKLRSLALFALVLAVLAVAVNVGLPMLHTRMKYDDMELRTGILDPAAPRSVSGGAAGCLSYGPYISLPAGEYIFRVSYSADTAGNWVDVYTPGFQQYKADLDPDKRLHTIRMTFDEDQESLEVRTYYAGTGNFTLNSLEIIGIRKDIVAVQKVLNITLVVALVVGCVWILLNKRTKQAEESPAIPWKKRILMALPPVLLLTCTAFLTGPIMLYLSNKDEFWFSLGQMLPVFLVLFAVGTLAVLGLLSALRGKWFQIVLGLVFGLGTALYIEGNFLMRDYGLLAGNNIDFGSYAGWAVIDTLIWIVILAAPLVILRYKRGVFEKTIKYGASFLLLTSLTACGISLVTSDNLDGNEELLLTTENFNELSNEENIIIMVWDAFDSDFMTDLLDGNPNYAEMLDGFTWYRDASNVSSTTGPSLPQIMTGLYWKEEVPYNSFIDLAWQYAPLYDALAENGFDIGLYTHPSFISRDISNLIFNIYVGRPYVTSQGKLAEGMMKFTAFRYLPHILRGKFVVFSDIFDELKGGPEGVENYAHDTEQPFELMQRQNTFTDEKKAFRLYHYFGAHGPLHINENAEIVPNVETSETRQMIGDMKILRDYIEQLKDAGVYDKTTLIVMADHGNIDGCWFNPLFMIKPKNARGTLTVTDAPISYHELLPTLLEVLGEDYSPYGRTVYEVGENEQRIRENWWWWPVDEDEDGQNHMTLYKCTGMATNWEDWEKLGQWPYALTEPLNAVKAADTVEAYGRLKNVLIHDMAEIEYSLPRLSEKSSLKLRVYTVDNASYQMTIYADDREIYSGAVPVEDAVLELPDTLEDGKVRLRFELPDDKNAAALASFCFISNDIP